jgi:hypothetical protein
VAAILQDGAWFRESCLRAVAQLHLFHLPEAVLGLCLEPTVRV